MLERLRGVYGAMTWRPHRDPTSELVLTILSQHTNDRLSGQAFARLLQAFPDWDAVALAESEAIVDCIKVGGLAQQKAPRIKAVLLQVSGLTGGYDLSFLAHMPLDHAKQWLTALPGVGPKTAACVLMFALGRPAIPVDTHVYRVSRRLGLIPEKMSADKAHEHLEALVAPADAYAFHVALIRLGRHVCLAQRPRCDGCALGDVCPSSTVRGERRSSRPDAGAEMA